MKKVKLGMIIFIAIITLITVMSIGGCKRTTTETAAETTAAQTAAETTAAETTAEKTTTAQASDLTFGYISKLLTHPWFTTESAGLEKFCNENGIKYISADANMDDELCLKLVDDLINQGIDALFICVTSQGIGPAVTEKCEKAGIPVMTIDDTIVDHNGKPVPHVGMPTKDVGIMGGEALAKLANERGFFKEGNVYKLMNVGSAKLSVLMERTEGFTEAITKNTPIKDPDDVIFVETEDGMMNNALPACNATVSANPKVTHWIATGINDDCAIAAIRAFEELGIPKSNYLSCGLGGYDLALEELDKGNDSFITVGLRPDNEGYQAAQLMFEFLTKGTPLPEITYVGGTIVDVNNYKESPFWTGK